MPQRVHGCVAHRLKILTNYRVFWDRLLFRRTAHFEDFSFLRSRCENPQFAGALNPDSHF